MELCGEKCGLTHLWLTTRPLRVAGDVNTADFPRCLSGTGLFTDLPSMTPAPDLIAYDVNVPL